jgi:hypothetical protein
MKFSEVISRLKEFYKTENLDKLSHNIGININDLKLAFINRDLKTINIFLQKNRNCLLPILKNSNLKNKIRKINSSSKKINNAIEDLKELYGSSDLTYIANKIDISFETLNELISSEDYDIFIGNINSKYEERKEAVEYILLKAEVRLKLQEEIVFAPEDTENKSLYFSELLKDFNKSKKRINIFLKNAREFFQTKNIDLISKSINIDEFVFKRYLKTNDYEKIMETLKSNYLNNRRFIEYLGYKKQLSLHYCVDFFDIDENIENKYEYVKKLIGTNIAPINIKQIKKKRENAAAREIINLINKKG